MAHRPRRLLGDLARVLVLISMLTWGTVAPAHAQADRAENAVIAVVQQQLSAFAADDADQAFKFAAPGIKAMSGNAQNFMLLVKTRYAAVYRHTNSAFLKPIILGKAALLKVRLTDDNGVEWIASYTLEKHKNKEWLITGCQLLVEQGNFV